MSEETEVAQARARVAYMLENDAFSQWMGLELLNVAPGRVSARMRIRDDMLNGFKVGHGGITFAFADSVLAFASNTHGRLTVSIENSIAYPAKVVAGDVLTASAEELSAGFRIATYQVIVSKQDGARVGIFRGTVYRTDKPLLQEE